jgi:hypothetical protein
MCAFCLSHDASIESWKFSSNRTHVAVFEDVPPETGVRKEGVGG